MFLLEVSNGTSTFVYRDEIIEGEPTRSEQTSGREVQLGSVNVNIDGSFLGLEDPCGLPHPSTCQGFRARLKFDDEVIIDGIIYRTSPSYDGRTDSWQLEIVNEALKDFYDKLKEIELVKLAINYVELECFVNNFGFSSSFAVGAEKPKWYAISDIWNGVRAVLSSLHGIDVYSYTSLGGSNPNWNIPTFTLIQNYALGNYTRMIDGYLCGSYDVNYDAWRNPTPKFSLPKWSGYEFWEFYSNLVGLKVVGKYTDFPNCKVKIECFQEINATRQPVNNLDANLLSDTEASTEVNTSPYTLQNTEPLYTDFATAYTNNFGEPMPNSSVPYNFPVKAYGIPAIYGYEKYRVETNEKVTRPVNEDLLDLQVYLPFYLAETVNTSTINGLVTETTYGIPILSEGKDEVYLGIWEDPTPTPVVAKMVIQRKWTDGANREVYNAEHWATNIMNMYPVSRKERCTAVADFCTDGIDLDVGNQVNNFLGEEWIVEAFDQNPKGQYYSGVQLLKVDNEVEWINAGRQPVTPPQNPTTQLVTIPFGGGNFRYQITLRWDLSTIPTVATDFEIEHFNPSLNIWNNVSTQPSTANPNSYATAFVVSTTGINSIKETFRVRGKAGAMVSDWVLFPISS